MCDAVNNSKAAVLIFDVTEHGKGIQVPYFEASEKTQRLYDEAQTRGAELRASLQQEHPQSPGGTTYMALLDSTNVGNYIPVGGPLRREVAERFGPWWVLEHCEARGKLESDVRVVLFDTRPEGFGDNVGVELVARSTIETLIG